MSQKKGIIFTLMNRVLLLFDSVFHAKNIIENDYPLKFIFDTINNRIKDINCENLVLTSQREINKFILIYRTFLILTKKLEQFNRNDQGFLL